MFLGRFLMADNDLPSYRKAVYLVFDVIALGFVLEGVPRLIRQEWAGGSLLLAIAIVLIFVGIAIAKRVSEIQDAVKILWDRLPSQKKLAASLAENESLKKQLAAASTPQASMLKIHSAIYGIGNANDADLTEILQNAQREGLWLVVNNNLLPPGSKDPAPGSLKLLTVIYSFGNDPKKYTTVREEYQELVLPEDAGLIERTAKEYDDKGLADRAAQASTHDSERQRLEAEKTDLRRDLAMRPTQQDLVKLQNENADLRALLPPPLPPAPISVLAGC